MISRCRAARISAALALPFVGCSSDRTGEATTPPSAIALGTWRGDVSVPGPQPAIGVLFDITDSAGVPTVRMVAAPNMGFGGATMTDVRVSDDSISFDWTRQDETRHCALGLTPEAAYLGACRRDGDAGFAMRMVPPGVDAPTGLARALLEMSSIQWIPSEHGATRLYAPSDAEAAVDRAAVARAISHLREDYRELLGDTALSHRIDVFLVDERDMMRRLVGRPSGGWTDPMASTLLVTRWGTASNALRHEAGHALQFNAWGPPYKGIPMLGEGLATWLAGTCAGHAVHPLVADVDSIERRIPLRRLYDDFHRQDDLIAYLESASVMGFLLEAHGRDALRRFWSEGEAGLAGIGLDLAGLEAAWLAFLRSVDPAGADWTTLRATGCG